MGLDWKLQRGGGIQTKKPSVGGVWIFSGTTQYLNKLLLLLLLLLWFGLGLVIKHNPTHTNVLPIKHNQTLLISNRITVKLDVLLMGTLQCCGAMFQYWLGVCSTQLMQFAWASCKVRFHLPRIERNNSTGLVQIAKPGNRNLLE